MEQSWKDLLIELENKRIKRMDQAAKQEAGPRSKRHPESDEGEGSRGGGE